MGLTSSLVITPLTERVFLGITQALQHSFSAAITGPAGSGKTATVRDLSKIFGTLCIFTSCSRLINKQNINNIFATLCNEGLWGCFEDLIEIDVSVISMVTIELNAIRCASLSKAQSLHMDGFDINFEPSTQIIITSNIFYSSKNKKLPESIKLLFRPVGCLLPNIEDICYAILLSEGFYNAKVLSKKITRLYEMADNILFHSNHYDFSLRSLKSLLVKCGNFRRSAPDIEEDAVILRALRDINLSKLSTGDNKLLLKLIKDLFPSTDCPDLTHPKFEKAIRAVWKSKGYIFIPKLMDKVFQMYEIIKIRQFAAIVGHTGGGKTFIVNTICSAQSLIGNHSKVIRITPKSYSIVELFGSYDDLTTKWSDGLFTQIFREFTKSSEKHASNYILFDGEIEDSWFQSISSLMDDDKLLMLTSCERIPLTKNCYVLFEVGSLQSTSPRFISRIGVVYVDFRRLEYHPYWEHWVKSRIDERERELLKIYFKKYVPSCISLFFDGIDNSNAMIPLKAIIHQTSLNMVVQLCFILDCLIPVIENENDNKNFKQQSNEFIEYELESIFIQAIYLSIGECLSLKDKEIFDRFMKCKIDFPMINDSKKNTASYGTIPTKMDTLFDYKLDREMKCWHALEDCVESYIHECLCVDEIIVPTKDSCRIMWILNLINEHNVTQISYKSLKYKLKAHKKKRRPILLVGEPSSSKTTLLKEFSRCLCFNDYDQLHLNFSTITLASKFQVAIEDRLQEHVSYAWKPKDGKKLTVFIDDLNNSQIVKTTMGQPKAFLKMLLENDGMFTRDGRFIWKIIKNIYFFSAMDILHPVDHEDHRFLSLFSIFYLHNPSQEVIKQIFASVLEAHTNSFEEKVKEIVPGLVLATINIYMFTLSNLLPTPSKFHYVYNLKDLSRIIQGLLQTSKLIFRRSEQILRVWRNEVTRVLWDRLIEKHEQDIVHRLMETTLQDFFPSSTEYVMQDPLLFGDYRNAMQPDLPRDYEDLLDYEAVYHLFTEILQYLNRANSKNEIVLFEVALEHLTRIHRILRLYRGHAMIIGPVGSGKHTVVHLASFTAGCKIVELPNNFQNSEFIRNIKKLLYSIIFNDQKTTLIVKNHLIINEGFLEIINNLMSRDDSLSIFSNMEKLSIISEIQKLENFPSDFPDKNEIWKHLEIKCKQFLHILLLMTPSMDFLRSKFLKFPGLINNATIDWMTSWPTEALYAVGRRFINEAVNVPEQFKKSIVESIVYVHERSSEYLEKTESICFQAYITPKHYLDFIKLYLHLFEMKHFQITAQNQLFEIAIEKVNEAIKDLKVLHIKIDSQKSIVKEKENICTTILMTMSKVSDKLNSMKNSVEEKKKEIKLLNEELTLHMGEIQTGLEKTMEDIYQAIESIKNVDTETFKQISAQENPSEITLIIFECVIIILNKSEVNWNSIKDFLCDTNNITSLEEIDLNSITIHQQKQVRGRLKRLAKLMEPSTISETEWRFLHLVEVLVGYCKLLRENKPRQERIACLNTEIDIAQNFLNSSKVEIEQLEIEVKVNNEKNELEKADKYKAHCELEISVTILEAAEKLVYGLTSEHSSWKKKLNTLKQEKAHIIGNNLISASFLVYTGIFNYETRKELMQLWTNFLKTKEIPFSSNFKLETELVDTVLLRRWIAAGLSDNEFSIQNAILFTYSSRIPLCIDPKEEAVNWIMCMEDVNSFKVISYENINFHKQLEIAKKDNFSVLIKDADCIDPLVLQTIEAGRGVKPIFNLESLAEDFIMRKNCYYLATKNTHPKFNPDVYSLTTVINFSVGKMELHDKLLDFIFEYEQKDYWDQRKEIILNKFIKQDLLKKLEDSLIFKVGKSEFGLLEHINFIETLNDIKMQIEEMRIKFDAEATALSQNNKQRNKYETLSKSISILYFTLSDMYIINCMYEISIQLFFDILCYLWKNIVPKLTKNLNEKEKIENLIKFMKKFFYDFQCRGMFVMLLY
ncbi:dynein axonemal heavy chain 10 [Halyomorpha halys]|uniref:dynein axonemal heavy chain 10 n=1 Tax=Halyomorpha halys TaxID=286706 RepID=UPI0034D37484